MMNKTVFQMNRINTNRFKPQIFKYCKDGSFFPCMTCGRIEVILSPMFIRRICKSVYLYPLLLPHILNLNINLTKKILNTILK